MTTKKLQKSYFDVLGLCCSSEIPLIEKLLRPLDGVKEVSVVVASRTVIVVHDNLVISQLQIVNVLNKSRLEANVRVHGEANYNNKWPSPFAIACGLLLLLSFLKYVYDPFKWLAIVAVVIGILPIILKGYAALRNFTLDTNILVLIAVMGSIALGDYWEAGSIVFLFTIAQWLESRASHKATTVMSSLMNMVPQKAILAETGEEIDASEVSLNTILAVKPGENIPIDGIVVDGKCEVDEKTLTGESFPVSKQIDSIVWAGTLNLNGYISVKTTALAEDCVVAKMTKLVEEAQNNKSQTQRFIDKCAKFYTPAIVAISISIAAIPTILKVHNLKHWLHLALVVLVSACPCALILSTPVAMFCALSKAATSGLLIKGGEYLETLSKIKIMGFDKTGTITRGDFVVTNFDAMVADVTLNTLLYWVSSIESKSSHPMAAALIDYAQLLSIKPKPENVEEFENFPGEGIYGKIDGKVIYVGNRKIASRAGGGAGPCLGGTIGEGKSIGYIFLGGDCAGIFSLSDTCRSGAKEAINELKSMGIKTAMLTGDSNEAATIAQNQLDGALEMVYAELLPQDKAIIIKDFQKQAPTAMVGDGLNDAPALATADIGISMGVSGSALATETGHVILMSNDIRKIPQVLKLARRTRKKVVQNVVISILTKVAILGLAIGGYPLVWAAVLADVGTCLVVIFNSMLLLKCKEEKAKHCCKSSWKIWKRGSHSNTDHVHHRCHSHDHDHDHDHNHNHNHNHNHSHLVEEHKKHCSSPCHDNKTFTKPNQRKSCQSSHSHKHGHNSSFTQEKGWCGHTEPSLEMKQDHNYKKNISNMPCHGHSKVHDDCKGSKSKPKPKSCHVQVNNLSASRTNGCCAHKDQLEKVKHSHNHDHGREHDGEPNHEGTNGCCEQKAQIQEVEHTRVHNTGHNGKHKHEENAHSLVKEHEHFVDIVKEDPSEQVYSHDQCHHSAHCIEKHEENYYINDDLASCCTCEHECDNNDNSKSLSLHEIRGCGTTRACSSNLEKRLVSDCCQSFREECCGQKINFGDHIGGLSKIVVE